MIRLYAGLTGRSVARPDLLDRARRAMGQVEQQSLEHYVWTGEAGSEEFLAAADTEVLAGSDVAPVPLEEGVGRWRRTSPTGPACSACCGRRGGRPGGSRARA
ncbi:hypothetical protein [Micromonospora sp. NPDC047527]|uniref:hypothetical protein n=1 Tax=Micromonospora sp. NPDC047527 TaxID=3155144 RepID=UPI00340F369C